MVGLSDLLKATEGRFGTSNVTPEVVARANQPTAPQPTVGTQATSPGSSVQASQRPQDIYKFLSQPGAPGYVDLLGQRYSLSGPNTLGYQSSELVSIRDPITGRTYQVPASGGTYDLSSILQDQDPGIGSAAAGGSGLPNTTVTRHPDENIQNLPLLQFLLGNLSSGQFGNVATGTVPGAFGTQIPEAGNVNFAQLLQVMQDPVAFAMLDSLLRSANRDIGSYQSQVQARAPFGQAVNPSVVRT